MDRKHLLATAAALIVIGRRHRRRLRRERREWVQKWLLDRGCYGAVANLMKSQLNDAAFQGFLRMTPEAFHQLLLDMITSLIQKQDTMMREAISPYEMVALTLRYLAYSNLTSLNSAYLLT